MSSPFFVSDGALVRGVGFDLLMLGIFCERLMPGVFRRVRLWEGGGRDGQHCVDYDCLYI